MIFNMTTKRDLNREYYYKNFKMFKEKLPGMIIMIIKQDLRFYATTFDNYKIMFDTLTIEERKELYSVYIPKKYEVMIGGVYCGR